MPDSVRIDATQVLASLTRAEAALSPASIEEFLKGPADSFLKDRTAGRFAGGGDDAVGTWAALSAYTVADRLIKGYAPGPPNVRSGGLQQWITQASGTTQVTTDSASLDFPGPGGALEESKLNVAQKGLSPNPVPGWKDVPARPVVALAEKDAAEITSMFDLWLAEKMSTGFGAE